MSHVIDILTTWWFAYFIGVHLRLRSNFDTMPATIVTSIQVFALAWAIARMWMPR